MSIFEPLPTCGCNKPDCYFCGLRNRNYWTFPGLKPETPLDVFNMVCRLTGANPEAVKSKSRKIENVIPRQIYCLVACTITDATLSEIGDVIGGRDYTTVIHSCNKIKSNIEGKDKKTIEMYHKIRHLIKN